MARKKKEETEEVKKPKAIGPFDIIKMMFTDKESFDKLSNAMLSKNFFMINRVMSIQFPLQAQCFNTIDIDQAQVVRSWQQFAVLKCGYGRVPSFVYTKTIKSANQELEKDNISKETRDAYCSHYRISFKDLDDMLYFSHDATIEHIKNFEKVTSTTEQFKSISKL